MKIEDKHDLEMNGGGGQINLSKQLQLTEFRDGDSQDFEGGNGPGNNDQTAAMISPSSQISKYTFVQNGSNDRPGDFHNSQEDYLQNPILPTSMQNVLKEGRVKFKSDSTGGFPQTSRLEKMKVELVDQTP